MSSENLRILSWSRLEPPTEAAIRRIYVAAGLTPYRWSNAPGDVYTHHAHDYAKVLYVVEGAITFGLPTLNQRLVMRAGDRLDLPAGIAHDAVVGPAGVVCLEAHLKPG